MLSPVQLVRGGLAAREPRLAAATSLPPPSRFSLLACLQHLREQDPLHVSVYSVDRYSPMFLLCCITFLPSLRHPPSRLSSSSSRSRATMGFLAT